MTSTSTESEETEDFTGLVSPEGLPFDLAQAELARSLPLAALSLAIGATTPYLTEFLANSVNGDVLPALERFADWCASNINVAGLDSWLGYLADSRAMALTNLWNAYDPEHLVEDDVRDTAGDEVIGAALWFSHLADVGIVGSDDEPKWCSLWDWLIVEDLFTDDENEDDGDRESTNSPTNEEDEW